MATPNQFGFDLNAMFQLNELNMPDKRPEVFSQDGGLSVLDYIITNNAPAVRTEGLNGEFEVPIIGDSNRVAQTVGAAVAVGSDIRVNFADPTWDKFRVGEVLTDGSAARNKGRVKAKGAGYVILGVVPSITTWNTGLHFTAGSYVTDYWVADPQKRQSGPESLFQVPFYKKFRTSATSESCTLTEADLAKAWYDKNTGMIGFKQIEFMKQRFVNALESKALFSEYGVQNEFDGTVQYSEGFYQAVKNADTGGVYMPLANIPTYSDFTRFAGKVADRRNEAKTKLSFLLGRKMLGVIQNFPKISSQIENAGSHNTFGGANIKGYDVYNYSFEGIECEFMMLPSLNNTIKYPTPSSLTSDGTRDQYTMICIDFGYRNTKDGDIVPAVQKNYKGNNEIVVGTVRGSLADFGMGAEAQAQRGVIQGANSSNSLTVDMRSDCAYRWLPYFGGLMELAS